MMDAAHLIFLFLTIGVIAFLDSCVGHAGASGYIAVMTLFGLVTTTIRPTALVLNILVAIIASFQFWRTGHFSWKLFWPFALLSVPAAYLGGYLQLPKGPIASPAASCSVELIARRERPIHLRENIRAALCSPEVSDPGYRKPQH